MFYRLKMALARFMYGRYGSDRLNRALLIAYLVIAIVNFIVGFFNDSVAVYLVFWIILTAIFIITVLRMFSRNIYARQRENAAYLRFIGNIGNRFRVISGNLREHDKKYVICPSCKAVIRFPRKKGTHSASCPKCRAKLTVKV